MFSREMASSAIYQRTLTRKVPGKVWFVYVGHLPHAHGPDSALEPAVLGCLRKVESLVGDVSSMNSAVWLTERTKRRQMAFLSRGTHGRICGKNRNP